MLGWRSFFGAKRLLSLWGGLYYSFPLQLLGLHFQRNQLLLGLWVLIALCFVRALGNLFGIPYLFLSPEYLHRVWFWSFFMLGGSLGVFTALYQMTCYILYSNRFAFLGLLRRPFLKFSVNNSLLPLFFHVLFFVEMLRFQYVNQPVFVLFLEQVVGYLAGLLGVLLLFYLCAHFSHTDMSGSLAKGVDKGLKKLKISRGQAMQRLEEARRRKYHLRTFLDERLRVCFLARMPGRYDKRKALEVFNQNHLSALVLGLLLLWGLLLSGIFRETVYVQLPAAASLILMGSLLLLLVGALSYWFRAWSFCIFILWLLGLHVLVSWGGLPAFHQALGLNYGQKMAAYTDKRLRDLSNSSQQIVDQDSTKAILHRWRAQYPVEAPPKLLLIAASGGGLRATLWTVRTLQVADSLLQGELMRHTALITGASGGMLGAAYYRELYLQHRKGAQILLWDSQHLQNISKDLLNPIIFSLLVHDLFLQPYSFSKDGQRYFYDRGRAFEEQLNHSTAQLLNKPLKAYQEPERSALVPMVFLGATIANEGRRLYISPQRVSYMTRSYMSYPSTEPSVPDQLLGVDFGTFFEHQGAAGLSFLTALRMNASFPYILPLVSLPSEPTMYVMDAGIFDNYGILDALKFVYVFRDWLRKNTSGVVLLAIRDHPTGRVLFPIEKNSLLHQLVAPISSVYTNLINMQDLRNHTHMMQFQEMLGVPLQSIALSYAPDSAHYRTPFKASLSWRLTYQEKMSIIENIHERHNKKALHRLIEELKLQQSALNTQENRP